ncbi:MAG: FtsX-like permease family protein [Longimicrobiales bacterium]|nr:FtsX-like permease family protein [Longimicrobiales bacterium]
MIGFLASREARTTLPRVGPYMLSIALGVAALVSIHSFRQDVARSVRDEAQLLMGADLRLQGNAPLGPALSAMIDSVEAAGHASAGVVSAVSMASPPPGGTPRLVQLRAVEAGWPFYGEIETRPAGVWSRVAEPGRILVDEAIATQLGRTIGDSVTIGSANFEIIGVVRSVPTEVGLQTAIGARIWMSPEDLDAADIIGFGSLARYTTYVTMPALGERAAIETRYEAVMQAEGIDFDTAVEEARNLTRAVGFLGRYLALIGLGALLLGGVGVGSAIGVFVRERLPSIAVLRCLGASQNEVFAAYLLQAGALGLFGAGIGAVAGVGIQHLLPALLAGVMPVPITPRVDLLTVGAGIAVGVWVSLVFALLPLLGVREVPPLAALRSDAVDAAPANRSLRAAAVLFLALSVVGTSVLEAPSTADGLVFAAALAVAVAVLWGSARLVVGLARRLLPERAPWPVRQGVSSLFRPGNQTISVILALGFGTFILGVIGGVQSSLATSLALEIDGTRPNLLLFDVQRDQVDGVRELFPDSLRAGVDVTPLVPSRIVAIRGMERSELDTLPPPVRPSPWALRREYRNSWRAEPGRGEGVVEGAWWDAAPEVEEGVLRVSLEDDVAEDLRVTLGDRITWDVAGQMIETEVVSLRSVEWDQLEPNFFVLFEPGAIDHLPATWIVFGRAGDEDTRAAVQGEVVRRYPNVSMLDIGRIQEVIDRILSGVDRAIGFLAGFAAIAGLIVLAGALAVTRGERLREAALLRTLGADRRRILMILGVEYAILGTLAVAVGLSLATGASWLVVTQLFQIDLDLDPVMQGGLALGVVTLTLVVGWVGTRGLLVHPPLRVLRSGE